MNTQNHTRIKNILFFLVFSVSFDIFASKISNSGDSIENDEAIESSVKIENINNEKKLFDFLKIINTFTQTEKERIKNENEDAKTPFIRVVKPQENQDIKICIIGDLHGSISALVSNLSQLIHDGYLKLIEKSTEAFDLVITNQNFYMILLGDYTDRCQDGVFVLSLLAQLKMANPDNVFLLKGNHENAEINYRDGLHAEFCTKFFFNSINNTENKESFNKNIKTLWLAMQDFYNTLPSALFFVIDNKILHFSHGGFDPHVCVSDVIKKNKKVVSITSIYTKTIPSIDTQEDLCIKQMNEDAQKHDEPDYWYLWADFSGKKSSTFKESRGINMGTNITTQYIKDAKKDGYEITFIRGHSDKNFGMKLIEPNNDIPVHWKKVVTSLPTNTTQITSTNNTHTCTNIPFNLLGNIMTFSCASGIFLSNKNKQARACNENCYGIIKIPAIEKSMANWTLDLYEQNAYKPCKVQYDYGEINDPFLTSKTSDLLYIFKACEKEILTLLIEWNTITSLMTIDNALKNEQYIITPDEKFEQFFKDYDGWLSKQHMIVFENIYTKIVKKIHDGDFETLFTLPQDIATWRKTMQDELKPFMQQKNEFAIAIKKAHLQILKQIENNK